jgi:polyhydroxybutyrate depolymerase
MRSVAAYVSALCLCLILAARAGALERRTWTVDGVEREALLHIPADSKSPLPTVFVFHGHGGTSANAARSFRMHELWPDALVVYPQGLKTPGRLTDPEGKANGWQIRAGDQGDRDLKFFDAMLKSLRDEGRVDERRVYVTGHSNGGAFTYLLWANRADALAAVAPSGALDAQSAKQLKAKPALHVAGRSDPLVKFAWQQQMINAVLAVNGCDRDGTKDGGNVTRYASKIGAPLVTFIHDGGHRFPPEAAQVIVDFFKTQPTAAGAATEAKPAEKTRSQ